MQHVNIHFVCTSDSVTPLEMVETIATLENEGFEVFDAFSNENVLVVAPLLLVICDNPRASELLNHLGSAANMFCRLCEVLYKLTLDVLILVCMFCRLIRGTHHML